MSLVLALLLCLSLLPCGALAGEEAIPERTGEPVLDPVFEDSLDGASDYDPANYTPEKVRDRILAMRSKYPERSSWTRDNLYTLSVPVNINGYPVVYTGNGCDAFALLLSDAAFGDLPARMVYSFTYDDIRAGDVLGVDNNTHTVIVLEKYDDHLVLAEGNYNRSVHWGRTIPRSEAEEASYIITRYPDPSAGQNVTPGWKKTGAGWRYQNADGSYLAGTWESIGGIWYHFDNSGYMQTGWQKISGDWYYFESSGAMKTGWVKSGSDWYYLKSDGVMAASATLTIGGTEYSFDSSGRWI